MKKLFYVFMLLAVYLSYGQTSPQNFNSPLNFNSVAEGPTATKMLALLPNNRVVWRNVNDFGYLKPQSDFHEEDLGFEFNSYTLEVIGRGSNFEMDAEGNIDINSGQSFSLVPGDITLNTLGVGKILFQGAPDAFQFAEYDIDYLPNWDNNPLSIMPAGWVNARIAEEISGLTSDHEDLSGLQGGSTGEHYHFTASQHSELLALIYNELTATLSTSPTSAERGINTNVDLNINIADNDDIITSATINQGIGDVIGLVDDGPVSIDAGSLNQSTTYTLTLNYTRNGTPDSTTRNATFNTYVAQWAGISTEDDFADYTAINSEAGFQKYIQSSSVITKVVSPTAQYVWFIVNNGTGQVLDGNNFVQTVGTWDDGVSEFYRKSLLITLPFGGIDATVYLVRSRNTKTLSSFTYKYVP